MSTEDNVSRVVRFTASGRLTAFHASASGGLVICLEASALDGLDLDEINTIGATATAEITVAADVDVTVPGAA